MNPAVVVPASGNVAVTLDSKTLEQCIKTVSRIGETVYQNICTGQATALPWGEMDYFWTGLLAVGGAASVLLILGFITALAFSIINDTF